MRLQIRKDGIVYTMPFKDHAEMEGIVNNFMRSHVQGAVIAVENPAHEMTATDINFSQNWPIDPVPSDESLQVPGFKVVVKNMESRPDKDRYILLRAHVTPDGDTESTEVSYMINRTFDPGQLRQHWQDYLELTLA